MIILTFFTQIKQSCLITPIGRLESGWQKSSPVWASKNETKFLGRCERSQKYYKTLIIAICIWGHIPHDETTELQPSLTFIDYQSIVFKLQPYNKIMHRYMW